MQMFREKLKDYFYMQAIDVWMAGCMLFVFAALGEFVVVKVLDQRYQIYRKRESIQNTVSFFFKLSQDDLR